MNNFIKIKIYFFELKGEIKIKHTTELSQKLLSCEEENLITVWDATYVYIEKSSNYNFQKKSFSVYKGN